MKTCTVCRVEKEIDQFYLQKRESGNGACPKGRCKECEKKRVSAWGLVNKGRVDKNKKAYLDRNRVKHNARAASWRRKNPALVNHYSRRAVAAKMMAIPGWANDFLIEEAYHLSRLRSISTGIRWEVDHIVPLQSKLVCGLHVENNLRVIPMTMNRRKSNVVWPDMPGDC